MTPRILLGLSVGSGFEAADVAAVRAGGSGLTMTPAAAGTARRPLPADVRDAVRKAERVGDPWPADLSRQLGDVLAAAARDAAGRAGVDLRRVAAAGLLARNADGRASADGDHPAVAPAEWVAERTGVTVVTNFRGRDVAAGGTGRFVTPLADFLLYRDPGEDRVLVHLGAVTSLLFLPAGGKVADLVGFETGPGHRLLDDITSLGTRSREEFDPGGTKAVQGRCLEPLFDRWLTHPHLARRPPKVLLRAAFGAGFLWDAFDTARGLNGSLHDLLCTATQFVARCVGEGYWRWVPAAKPGVPRRVFVSGGGVRNGFLWKLLDPQFPGLPVDRLDVLGVPAGHRSAAAAGVLAGLTLDGVAGNLPLLTGATGGRLLGRIVPGDPRNWAACVAWMARQLGDHPNLRAA